MRRAKPKKRKRLKWSDCSPEEQARRTRVAVAARARKAQRDPNHVPPRHYTPAEIQALQDERTRPENGREQTDPNRPYPDHSTAGKVRS